MREPPANGSRVRTSWTGSSVLAEDPQLTHLEHIIQLPHHEGGHTAIEASRFRLSRSRARVDTSAPTFNRDMMYVLNDVLGYDDERLSELLVSGALE
jgi:crotonobetainyl-CoA:carnitine CoA-transferase CaiB-like acyl-CoA transferase